MHASDRYLIEGTIEDLRKEEGGAMGYAKRLAHGEIGKGCVEVHHTTPVSELGDNYILDPNEELLPLCLIWLI